MSRVVLSDLSDNKVVLPTNVSTFDRDRQRSVVFYGRVSTEHEAQLAALENQMQWYVDQAKYHPNWTVLKSYIDRGITGTQAKKRPAFMEMLNDAKYHKFDLIVNIPKNHSKRELTNGYKIRRGAIDHNIPLITNARLAGAFIEAFCEMKMEDIQIKSWQEYK